MHVLIIDDDDLIVEAASEYLARHDYQVQTARQFAAARALILAGDFDVILIEPRLTGGSVASGMEMVSWIRQQSPATRIGIFAPFCRLHITEEASQFGVSTVIPKPTTMRNVLTTVDALMAQEESNP